MPAADASCEVLYADQVLEHMSGIDAAREFVRRNAALFRLSEADVAALQVQDDHTLPGTAAHGVTFSQRFGDLVLDFFLVERADERRRASREVVFGYEWTIDSDPYVLYSLHWVEDTEETYVLRGPQAPPEVFTPYPPNSSAPRGSPMTHTR